MDSVFVVKQRAFLKLYLIQLIRQGKGYGLQLQGELERKFRPYGFIPTKTEIYRSLQDLMDDGILSRVKEKKDGARYAEIAVYSILDFDKADSYTRTVRKDIERSMGLLGLSLKDTEKNKPYG